MKLSEIYENYKNDDHHGDKGTIHTYIDAYETLLSPYRNNSTVLEIGIYEGLSLRMWNDYFIDSKVVGIDISNNDSIKQLTNYGIDVIIGNAAKPEILNQLSNYNFDVIIDDGSHLLSEQVMTFTMLKQKMKPGGIFIIEDIIDIDTSRTIFESLHDNIEIIDNRGIKNRSDDVLVIYRF